MAKRYFEVIGNYGVGGLRPRNDADNTSPLSLGTKAAIPLKSVAKRIFDTLQSISGDERLTKAGKRDSALRLGQDDSILSELEKGVELLNQMNGLRRTKTKAVNDLLGIDNRAENVLRRMELRQAIERIPVKERFSLLDSAVKSGDKEIVATFNDKPEIFGLVGIEPIRKAVFEYVKNQNPELANDYQDAEFATQTVASQYLRFLNDLEIWSGLEPQKIQAIREKLPLDVACPEWTDEENFTAQSGSMIEVDFVSPIRSTPAERIDAAIKNGANK